MLRRIRLFRSKSPNTPLLLVFLILAMSPMALNELWAQGPYCIGENCTANDIQDPVYFLGDSNGDVIASVMCTPGEPVGDVYLWLTFQVTATNRYDVNVIGDVNVDGFYDHTFNVCLGDFGSGMHTEMIGQLVWDCGAELIISNTLFSWENNDDGGGTNSCNTCPLVPSKCDRFGNLVVLAPVVANFSYYSECLPEFQYEVFTFTESTTGGAMPYANYVWDFGAGASPDPVTTSGPGATGPFVVTYDSPGIRTVSLTVTDQDGTTSSVEYDIDVLDNPDVSVSAEDGEICAGGSVTLTASVSGGTGISYQWQYYQGGNWTNTGSDQATYDTPALTLGAHQFRVIVSHDGECDVTSTTLVITAVGDPTVQVVAESTEICEGGSANLTAIVSGGTGTAHYQWQQLNGVVWEDVGTDASTYVSEALGLGTEEFRVLVQQDAGCSVTSAGAVISITTDPEVSVGVSDNEICNGGSVTLMAEVSGGAGTTSYQWQRYNGSSWTNVGLNQSTYHTPGLPVGSHDFRVIIEQNSGCSATSATLTITAVGDPTVELNAVANSICTGGMAELSAVVSGGTGVTHYQWQQFISGIWTNIGSDQSEFISSTLNIGTYQYRVLISQDAGCAVTSATSTITVVSDPTVSVSASNSALCEGGTTTLTAAVTGGAGPTHYQWQKLITSVWTNVGTDQATHPTGALPTGTHQYRVMITQNSGCSATSATFSVVVVGDPIVTVSADQTSLCIGGSALLTASVSGGSGTSHYQWQKFENNSWVNVGADQNTYSTGSLALGSTQFRVVITQDEGCNGTSAGTTITVVTDPTVSVAANDDSICEGGTVTLTAQVSGGTGQTHFQWQQNVNDIWTNVGSDQNTYSTSPLNVGDYEYRVLITQNNGCSATSATSFITVVGDPAVQLNVDASMICTGGSANFEAVVSGGTGVTHYYWQRLINSVWTDVGNDSPNFSTPVLPIGSYSYRVVIVQDAGCEVISANQTIQVVADPTVSVVASNSAICLGGSSTLFANVSGGAGVTHYQWQQLVNNIWTSIGQDQPSIIVSPGTTGTFQFRVMITQNSGCTVNSASTSVTVVNDPVVSIEAFESSVCDGGMAQLTAIVDGGTGTPHFQWQSSINGGPWTNIGSDQATYTSSELLVGLTYEYRVNLTQGSGCDVQSAAYEIVVVGDPVVEVNTEDANICNGGSASLSSTVTGGTGAISYQWQEWSNNTWNDIAGATGAVYSTPALTQNGTFSFRLFVMQNSGCDVASTPVEVSVVDGPSVEVTASENNICDGGSATLTAVVIGGAGNPNYQWEMFDGIDWIPVGDDSDTYETGVLGIGTFSYRVQIEQGSGCALTSAQEVISVVIDPGVNVDATDNEICEGGQVTLSAIVNGGAGTSSFQWQEFIAGNWADIGDDQPDFMTSELSLGTYEYRVIVTQNSGCSTTSTTSIIEVVDDPVVTILAEDYTICEGGLAVLTADYSGGTGFPHFQWEVSSNGGPFVAVGDDAPNYTSPPQLLGNYEYRVTLLQDAGCAATSDGAMINVINKPVVVVDASNNEICEGGTVMLEASVTGGAGSTIFQWQLMVNSIWTNVGSNQDTYETEPLEVGSYMYRVLISQNSGCDATSAGYLVTVVDDPQVAVEAEQLNICEGGTAELLAMVSGGTGTNHFQWQKQDGNSWLDIGGDESFLSSDPLAIGTHMYRVIVTQNAGCLVTSASVSISVVTDPGIEITSGDGHICAGEELTMSANVTGGAGASSYQWQEWVIDSWVDISGADESQYMTPPLGIGTHQYRVIVEQNSGCYTESAPFETTVTANPSASVSADTEICSGETTQITATPSGGTGPYTYLWNTGAVSQSISVSPTTTTTYSVTVFDAFGCSNISAAESTVIVYPSPTVNAGANQIICLTDTLIIDAAVSGGTGPFSFEWSNGETTQQIEVSPETTTTYFVTVTDANGCADVDQVQVTVNPCDGVIAGYVKDEFNTGVADVEIRLYADSNMDGDEAGETLLLTDFTDSEGAYLFEGMDPGLYVIVEIQPENYDDVDDYDRSISADDPDGNDSGQGPDNDIPVILAPFEGDLDNNFREDANIGSISGNVSTDLGEPITGVVIRLYGDSNSDGIADGAVLDSAVTDVSGDFEFVIEYGDFVLVQVHPANHTSLSDFDHSTGISDGDGDDSADGADDDIPVTVLPGENDTDNNFIEDAHVGLICGRVENEFGVGVANVTLHLYSDPNHDGDPSDGSIILTIINNGETGEFCFEDVEQGYYVIVEEQPAHYDNVSDYDHSIGGFDPDGDDSGEGWDNEIPVVLLPAEGDMDNIFIEDAHLGIIAGQVREDIGAAVPGVKIYLYFDSNNDGLPNDGPPVDSTTSDASGNYLFDFLEPESYVVKQIQPVGFVDVSDIDGSINTDDPDGDDGNTPNNIIPAIVSPGETDADNDFIEFAPLGLICGNVSDDNGNAVPNVTLHLYSDPDGDGDPSDGEIVLTTLNNGESGDFCFEDVYHGTYVIVEVQLGNYDNISDYDHTTGDFDPDGDDSADGWDNEIPVVLIPGESDADNNFIEDPHVGDISGYVTEDIGPAVAGVTLQLWNDFNGDGVPDPGSPIATVQSDVNGYYEFAGQEPGYYVVVELQPEGYVSISDIDETVNADDLDGNDGATPNDRIPVTLIPGESDEDNNFIENASEGLICGYVLDDNGNEIVNVQLELYTDPNGDGDYSDGELFATTTVNGETGEYCFEGVYHGNYVIHEIQPLNYDNVHDYDYTTGISDPDGDDSGLGWNNVIPVTLEPGEADSDNNFVEDPHQGNISGTVRMDSGIPISGVTLRLFTDVNMDGVPDGINPISTTTSDDFGSYVFALVEPGGYVVTEVQPVGFADISDIDGSVDANDPDGDDGISPNNKVPVIVTPGESDEDNDFVEYPYPGIICGTVFDDLGNPLPNVTLNLYTDPDGDGDHSDGTIYLTTTPNGETGLYCFEDVEYGSYVVVQDHPDNYDSVSDYDETPDPDGDDSSDGPNEVIPVFMDPAEADTENNFVEHPHVGFIYGNVREDIGIPVAGVEIKLFSDIDENNIPDSGTPLGTVLTNGTGDFSFDSITPGSYVIVQTQPQGYESISDIDASIDGNDPDGNDGGLPNEKIPVIITAGEYDEDNDFIELAYPGVICGNVSDDQGNELSNVTLELYLDENNDGIPDSGSPVMTTNSDGETGDYCFEVPHGIYVVVEIQPVNYDDVSDYDHSTGDNDEDGDDSILGANNRIPVVLYPAEADLDNNFIEDPHVGNISGNVRDEFGDLLTGVTIRLYNDANEDGIPDGGVIASVQTDAFGDYAFEGMEPGKYLLDQLQPNGYISISDIDESINADDLDGNDGGSPNERIPVILLAGETDADNNFVEFPLPGLICGSVFDINDNPLPNITLELIFDENGNGIADDPVVGTTITNGETGDYCFEDVMHGEYFIRQVHPTNYESVSDYDHSINNSDLDGDDSAEGPNDLIPVTLLPFESDTNNIFIEDPNPGFIQGYVLEADDTPMPDVTLEVFVDDNQDGNPDGAALGSVVTDADGYYSIDSLDQGRYVVIQTQPVNYFSISDYDHSTGDYDEDGDDSASGFNERILVVLDPGEVDSDNIYIEEPYPGAICGYVFDSFGNELGNVIIELYYDADQDGIADGPMLSNTTSDGETGGYCFEDLHYGGYLVKQIQPLSYTSASDYDHTTGSFDPDGIDTIGGPNNQIPVYLSPAEGDEDNNFIENPDPGIISGHVLEDGDVPMADVTLTLHLDADMNGQPDGGPIGTTMTDNSGYYSFEDVQMGAYVVQQVQPEFYFSISDYDHTTGGFDTDGDDSVQGADENIPVIIAPGESDEDNDFIEFPYPTLICGYVTDENDNVLSNVVIELYADENEDGIPDNGLPVFTTTTNGETGQFCIEDVPYGSYVLVEVPPGNYQYMSDYDHTTGSFDPDGDDSGEGTDGNIPVVTTPGEADMDNNFVNISCPGLPEVEGDTEYFICDGETVEINAEIQYISGVNYDWTFGELSDPSTGTGFGPHFVTYGWSQGNQENGAQVILTLTKEGCPTQTGEVARVFVSPIPDATIDADEFDLCALLPREFVPAALEIPGAIYTWDFGQGAMPASAIGYGPHFVVYEATGPKTVQLIVDPNYENLASCPDTSAINFDVIDCPGTIAGIVKDNEGVLLQGFPIQLWPDDNADGQPDGGLALETTFSNSVGQFAFTGVLPGNYVLKQVFFPGFIAIWDGDVSPDGDIAPNLNILDDLIPVTVQPGVDDIGNTFIKSSDRGSVCGAVFVDENDDGILDAGEGIENVKIKLLADADLDGLPDTTIVLDSVYSNEFGIYAFLAVDAGSFVLIEEQPTGYNSIADYDATPDGDLAPNFDSTDNIIPTTIVNMQVDDGNMYFEQQGCTLTVTNTDNSGYGSLRAALECASDGDTILFAQSLAGETIVTEGSVLTIDHDITLYCDVNPWVTVQSEVEGHVVIQPGADVLFRNIIIVSGPSGLAAAIHNQGVLTLDSTHVHAHPELIILGHNLIVNEGEISILGNTQIISE